MISSTSKQHDSHGYEHFLSSLQANFDKITANNRLMFTTNANTKGLFAIFLANIPEKDRQHYTCRACEKFVYEYGGLVSISQNGVATSLLWNPDKVPGFFKASVSALKAVVSESTINGVFYTASDMLGVDITGEWHHMHIKVKKCMVHSIKYQTAHQLMAKKKGCFINLSRNFDTYSPVALDQAITLLQTDSLPRSEKCLPHALWLKDIQNRLSTKKGTLRRNLLWFIVSISSEGFCNLNSSMLSTLIYDIMTGLSFESIKKRFAEKMDPQQYRRPQKQVSDGNINQAEKLIEKLGAKESLRRRFARVEELQTIWKPEEELPVETKKSSVFGHLKSESKQANINIPPITITWVKFRETVLESAKKIEFLISYKLENYSAILTAVDMGAPPIIQWDSEEERNPFSSYVYTKGSFPIDWDLKSGFCDVTCICFHPSMWYGQGSNQHEKSVFFILKNAKDKKYENVGAALFPEILKSEFHSIRSTIENYSKNAVIEGSKNSSACGIEIPKNGNNGNRIFRVKTKNNQIINYKIDRWD